MGWIVFSGDERKGDDDQFSSFPSFPIEHDRQPAEPNPGLTLGLLPSIREKELLLVPGI
jgi:hypothetical protein